MTATTIRHADLKQMLSERRRAIQDDVQTRIRDGRTDRSTDVCDDLERSEATIQGDVGFALLQMQTGTVARIDAALARLAAGTYGLCLECDGEISARRLRALPFAVRCQACEERREQEQGLAQRHASQRSSRALFPDAARF